MQPDNTRDPRDVLNSAKAILLVDWPNLNIPKTLLEAGFLVFCYSPNGYTKAEIVAEYPHDVNEKNIFPPGNKEEFLVFRPLPGPTPAIDIGNVYRPEQEHSSIITEVPLTLGATCIWLQPPVTSAKTHRLAEKSGLTFIQGYDIAQIAQEL